MAYIGPEPNPGQNREVDDISSGFNGSEVNFTLQVNSQNVSPGSSNAIIVSLGGVIQNPGTDYTVAASTLTFTTAPANGLSFFGLVLGQQVDTEGAADGSITTAKIADDAVTTAKIDDDAVTSAKLNDNSVVNAALDTVAQNRIKGRVSSGTGNVEDLTAAQVRTMINVADGATAGGGKVIAQYFSTSTAEFTSNSGSFQNAHTITFTPASATSKFLIHYMPARIIAGSGLDGEIRFSDGTSASQQFRLANGGSTYKTPSITFWHNHVRPNSPMTFTLQTRDISGGNNSFLVGDNGSPTVIIVLEIEQ